MHIPDRVRSVLIILGIGAVVIGKFGDCWWLVMLGMALLFVGLFKDLATNFARKRDI